MASNAAKSILERNGIWPNNPKYASALSVLTKKIDSGLSSTSYLIREGIHSDQVAQSLYGVSLESLRSLLGQS